MVREDGNLSDAEIAELAAFADGSLPARRRRKVAAAVERSPELRALLDEQRAALAAVRAVDVPAPARLRALVESSLPRPKPRPRWRGLALPAGIAAATAASVLLAVLVIPDGGPTQPSPRRRRWRTAVRARPPTARAERAQPAGRLGRRRRLPRLSRDVRLEGVRRTRRRPRRSRHANRVLRARARSHRLHDRLRRPAAVAAALEADAARRSGAALDRARRHDHGDVAQRRSHVRALRRGRTAGGTARPRRVEGRGHGLVLR